MSVEIESCSAFTTNTKIKLHDRKGGPAKIYFINSDRQKLQKIDVDCLKLNGKSCDYLLRIEEQLLEIYVELKGCRVKDAIEQIINTLKTLSSKSSQVHKYCYIVHTRCPPGTDIQQAKKKFNKQYQKEKAILLTRKSNSEEDLKKLSIS